MDWQAARDAMMLDPGIVNLNTGSFGPLPRPVFDAATEFRRMLAAEPTHFFVRQSPPLLWHARTRLAEFLRTVPTRLIFTTNVSSAINLVANGLTLTSPGEILLSDHEYGAMHWCWERAAQRHGLTIRTFALPRMPTSAAEIVDAATAAMNERTRLLFFSHVLSPTGMILPAEKLCAEARKRGIISVVDGAHATAMLPLDVDAVNADFYGGNCHKWLLAPTGSGFLVIGSGNEDRLRPLEVSWGYHYPRMAVDLSDEFGSTLRLRHIEFTGTRDICPWLAVPAAIDFQASLGFDAVRTRISELAAYVREKAFLPLATPVELGGALTAFELPAGTDPKRMRDRLWEKRVEMPVIERPDRLMVRFSTHFYTTEAEIDLGWEAVRHALG